MNELVDVVIPARNEQLSIGRVVRAFRHSPLVNRIYVLADACDDDTAIEAALSGADTICSFRWNSKGKAVTHAIRHHVTTRRVFLCDGDLWGFTTKHVTELIECETVGMAVGVPDIPANLPDHRLWAWPWVSGERVIPTQLARPMRLEGYLMETQLNRAARHAHLPLKFQFMRGCKSVYNMTDQRLADMERDLRLGRQLGILK